MVDKQLPTCRVPTVHHKHLLVAAEERDWVDSLADKGCPWSQGVGLADLRMLKGAEQGQPNQHFVSARATGNEMNGGLSIHHCKYHIIGPVP